MAELKLNGFSFQELFQPDALARLDAKFLAHLADKQPELEKNLLAYRQDSREFSALEVSELLLACSPSLERFVAKLFGVENALEISRLQTISNDPIFIFKKWFVLREAKRRLAKADTMLSFFELDAWLQEELSKLKLTSQDHELDVAQLGDTYLKNPEQYAEAIDKLICWCVRAMTDPAGQMSVRSWVSFHFPKKLDYKNLVPLQPVPNDPVGRFEGPPDTYHRRDGFKLTDPRMSPRQVLDEVHYCVYCHEQEGDFCSKGFPEKKSDPNSAFKINPLGDVLTGCPLEEKISEMHTLKKVGHTIAALAMIMVDNPMCPVTGHRICNDCMKGCIYQKQEPVNIPQTETGILTDVLKLPWGVEIYDLFTRWNPLRKTQWVAKPYNGLKILVMGMGPAGFSLAHHLLMEGFAVVGVDGLKIEPLPEHYITKPIYHYTDIKEQLDTRVMAGFGGVAEYGITVRWDKNFLKLIYISLMRRPYFQVFGGVRFGGTIEVEDVWKLGFAHLAVAVGAGLPKELNIPGSLAPGMRQANDFLMALQLTGAAKENSLANLQVRLPAVVIGGGLTGIDTATEVQAYYITQVEKTLQRYETLVQHLGEARIRQQFDEYSFEILNEFLTHGHAVRAERQRAAQSKELPNFIPLLRQWGGVTIAYRRLISESPAYKRNHEEIGKALEEGIFYAEGLEPVATRLDKHGHVEALVCKARVLDEKNNWILSDEEDVLPAKSIFVATGARPNIAYEYEHRGTFLRDGNEYRSYTDVDGELIYVPPDGHVKTQQFGAFTSYEKDNYRVTFLGDTHPVFHGNVVKAIASAKRTYPKIVTVMGAAATAIGDVKEYENFAKQMNYWFSSKVTKIHRHSPSVVEIKIQAPLAAKNFHPGQFYRLQNFETSALQINGTRLQTEAIALLGAGADQDKGELTLMVLEAGASTRLVALFPEGQSISLMGPTGARTKIPQDKETVLIMGGRLSVAYIRGVGPALRAAGNPVLYIAGFQTADELYCQAELEQSADKIVWITHAGEPIKPRRPQDCSATGELMSVVLQYARGELETFAGGPEIPLQQIDRVLVVGPQRLSRVVREASTSFLKELLAKNPPIFTSVHGPMQCMLKGVCAQCLQWQIDPQTGKRTKAVFTCSWQEQPLNMVDLDNLEERLAQNRVQEILSNLWLDQLLSTPAGAAA
jgi:NADPH-dependent glutamate synthase beta subunit-like oxidoreductase/NAD(P)H-flavin reductase